MLMDMTPRDEDSRYSVWKNDSATGCVERFKIALWGVVFLSASVGPERNGNDAHGGTYQRSSKMTRDVAPDQPLGGYPELPLYEQVVVAIRDRLLRTPVIEGTDRDARLRQERERRHQMAVGVLLECYHA